MQRSYLQCEPFPLKNSSRDPKNNFKCFVFSSTKCNVFSSLLLAILKIKVLKSIHGKDCLQSCEFSFDKLLQCVYCQCTFQKRYTMSCLYNFQYETYKSVKILQQTKNKLHILMCKLDRIFAEFDRQNLSYLPLTSIVIFR